LGVGGTAALASLRLPASEAAQTGRRNVLWVIDDDHPQYMMDSMPVTRHKIRDLGTNFISDSTDIPLCGPARVSLLTGLSVTTHKCDTNGTWPKFEGSSRGLGERTVARHLKDAGYTTEHFGKYINAHSRQVVAAKRRKDSVHPSRERGQGTLPDEIRPVPGAEQG
jgi:arylsulfatase A-like enzyme